jgi:flagellar motor switch/type III secretory pathway protein FliN
MADAGYDVADYRDIDPAFGTLAEAAALIDEAHALGIRIIIDIVPNHTSTAHAWFQRVPHATFAWAVQSTGPAPHEATSAADGSLADQLEREVASSLLAELCLVDRRQPVTVSRLSAQEIGEWSVHARAWTVHARAANARGFSVLLSASRVEMLAPARTAAPGGTLEPCRQAIGDNPVAVRGVIGDTSLSVTELAELAVDDVLVLDQALGEPVALVAPDSGRTIAAGSLGRAGPRRAIKVAAIAAHNG